MNALRVLPGSGLSVASNLSSITASSNFTGDTENDDPRSQAWFLLPQTTTFTYSFKGGYAAWQELGNLSMPGGTKPIRKYASTTYHSNKIIAILNHSPYQPLLYLNNKTKKHYEFS